MKKFSLKTKKILAFFLIVAASLIIISVIAIPGKRIYKGTDDVLIRDELEEMEQSDKDILYNIETEPNQDYAGIEKTQENNMDMAEQKEVAKSADEMPEFEEIFSEREKAFMKELEKMHIDADNAN